MGGWLLTKINGPHRALNLDTVTHPSTNRAQRRLTLLIESQGPGQRQPAMAIEVL